MTPKVDFDRFTVRSGSHQAGGVAQLASELGRRPLGSVVVLEGERVHRLQLAQAVARHLGYGLNIRAEKEWDLKASDPYGLLLFDEADSLFGPRTEVKDSHDRYANLFDQLPYFRGLLLIGADSRHSIPPFLLSRSKMIPVRDYWPPR